ncbi:hypothetical protein, unknown function [Leishmania tarentolae]|uniref:Surface antigen-like protein n=1 Tax=Leishmania tarentolae TaxID=5689 RepID=A0A640KFC5_LEITA|nr:hypothetical protein, unknown function [Leishmania tarentolae]
MTAIRKLTGLASVMIVTVLLFATSVTAQAGQLCSETANPFVNIDYTNESVQACVVARCTTTLNITPNVATDGFCDGVATSESSVACDKLEKAYNEYYACLVRAIQGTTVVGLTHVGAVASEFFATPGFPYRLSPLGCYACNHYRLTVFPSLASKCLNWTCASISSQSPSAPAYGEPDEGYNHRVCSTGCITGIMMIPFTFVTCALFLVCGCFWPSPSLKTTYEAMLRKESSQYVGHFGGCNGYVRDSDGFNTAHEPAPVRDQGSHPEVSAAHFKGK